MAGEKPPATCGPGYRFGMSTPYARPETMTWEELERLPEEIAEQIELWNRRVVWTGHEPGEHRTRRPGEHQIFTRRLTNSFERSARQDMLDRTEHGWVANLETNVFFGPTGKVRPRVLTQPPLMTPGPASSRASARPACRSVVRSHAIPWSDLEFWPGGEPHVRRIAAGRRERVRMIDMRSDLDSVVRPRAPLSAVPVKPHKPAPISPARACVFTVSS